MVWMTAFILVITVIIMVGTAILIIQVVRSNRPDVRQEFGLLFSKTLETDTFYIRLINKSKFDLYIEGWGFGNKFGQITGCGPLDYFTHTREMKLRNLKWEDDKPPSFVGGSWIESSVGWETALREWGLFKSQGGRTIEDIPKSEVFEAEDDVRDYFYLNLVSGVTLRTELQEKNESSFIKMKNWKGRF